MGQYRITIEGEGSHNNLGNPKDANRMAAKFVGEMIHAGHAIKAAEFIVIGGQEDISNPREYEAEWQKQEGGTPGGAGPKVPGTPAR